jgi:hypothetical protein
VGGEGGLESVGTQGQAARSLGTLNPKAARSVGLYCVCKQQTTDWWYTRLSLSVTRGYFRTQLSARGLTI